MECAQKYDEALQHLEVIRNSVVDTTAWLEAKGDFKFF